MGSITISVRVAEEEILYLGTGLARGLDILHAQFESSPVRVTRSVANVELRLLRVLGESPWSSLYLYIICVTQQICPASLFLTG